MPAVGDLLAGRYRIDARLGAGGMATVWRAHDLRLDRDVAVKVLLPNLAGDAAMAGRFDREARALAAISDPRVVAVFDVVDGDPATGREPFLVMELCPDGSLGERLDSAGTMSEREVVPLLAAAAEGVAALHARGIVHRDITPRNVLLAEGRAKIGDLGLARGAASGAALDQPPVGARTGPGTGAPTGPALGSAAFTPTGMTMGTLAYLAPEVLGGRPAGPPADVYGLAAVAYRALAGVPPRDAGPAHVARRAPVALGDLAPDVSEPLATLIMDALARDPAARPTAAVMASRLRALEQAGSAGPAPWTRAPADGRGRQATEVGPTHVAAARGVGDDLAGTSPLTRPSPAPRASPGRRPGGGGSAAPEPRSRTPPPGPSYRGPGLWSGELVLVLLVALAIVAVVVVLFGR